MLCFLALAGPVAYRYVCDFTGRRRPAPGPTENRKSKMANWAIYHSRFTIRNLPYSQFCLSCRERHERQIDKGARYK